MIKTNGGSAAALAALLCAQAGSAAVPSTPSSSPTPTRGGLPMSGRRSSGRRCVGSQRFPTIRRLPSMPARLQVAKNAASRAGVS